MSGINYGYKYTISRQERPLHNDFNEQKKKVYVFNKDEQLIEQYESVLEFINKTGIDPKTLRKHSRSRALYKGKYYSFSEELKPDTSIF